jgi:hypothetical protein
MQRGSASGRLLQRARTWGETWGEMTKPKWQTAERHGDNWHDYGPTRETARRLYLAHPFIPVGDLARLLKITLARFNVCIDDLRDDRKKRCADVLARVRKEEGL